MIDKRWQSMHSLWHAASLPSSNFYLDLHCVNFNHIMNKPYDFIDLELFFTIIDSRIGAFQKESTFKSMGKFFEANNEKHPIYSNRTTI